MSQQHLCTRVSEWDRETLLAWFNAGTLAIETATTTKNPTPVIITTFFDHSLVKFGVCPPSHIKQFFLSIDFFFVEKTIGKWFKEFDERVGGRWGLSFQDDDGTKSRMTIKSALVNSTQRRRQRHSESYKKERMKDKNTRKKSLLLSRQACSFEIFLFVPRNFHESITELSSSPFLASPSSLSKSHLSIISMSEEIFLVVFMLTAADIKIFSSFSLSFARVIWF